MKIPSATEKEKCWAKQRFSDYHGASQAGDNMRSRGKRVRIYHCPACRGFHLTGKQAR